MHALLIALLVVHGAIHAMGFMKAFELAPLAQLKRPIRKPMGIAWLCGGLLFLAAAAAFALASPAWWVLAGVGVVLSQTVIVSVWSDARFGTIANALIALPVSVSLLDLRSTSLRSRYAHDVDAGLAQSAQSAQINDADLERLPALVATYIKRTHAPRAQSFRIVFDGSMRQAPDKGWMDIHAEQHSFFRDERSRFFLITSSMYGLPFEGYHRYTNGTATMNIRVLSLFDVVDAKGSEMNRSETVTMLNDMCLLAPTTLIDAGITWEERGARAVRATFTNAGQRVSAELFFDEQGDLERFVSDDRDLSADGKTYRTLRWTTPVKMYREYHGVRLASYGEAAWNENGVDWVYARFTLTSIEYNDTRR